MAAGDTAMSVLATATPVVAAWLDGGLSLSDALMVMAMGLACGVLLWWVMR